MALFIVICLSLFGTIQGILNWRQALFSATLLAVVLDPLRKLVPGTPSYLVLATFPIFASLTIGMIFTTMRRRGPSDLSKINMAVMIFAFACVPAAAISMFYGPGSWMLTILGAASYSVIICSVYVGYRFASSEIILRKFIAFYCILSAVMLIGGVLEFWHIMPNSPLIGTKTLGMEWLRYNQGYTVKMIAGFYRSPDVMGWHAATVAMMSLLLATTGRGAGRWVWAAVSAFAIVALLLCGRRKMVYMLPLFISTVGLLYVTLGRKNAALGILALCVVPFVSVFIIGSWLGPDSPFVRYYTENQGQTPDRLQQDGFESLVTTYDQSGFFGSGLGVATPGSENLRVARPRTWQESGSSRILVELGVPGFAALLGVILAIFGRSWRVVRDAQRSGARSGLYPLFLTAFFLTNVGSLVVSGQILADPFIAFFLGFSIGAVLSFGREAPAVAAVRQRRSRYAAASMARGVAGP